MFLNLLCSFGTNTAAMQLSNHLCFCPDTTFNEIQTKYMLLRSFRWESIHKESLQPRLRIFSIKAARLNHRQAVCTMCFPVQFSFLSEAKRKTTSLLKHTDYLRFSLDHFCFRLSHYLQLVRSSKIKISVFFRKQKIFVLHSCDVTLFHFLIS